MNKIRVVIKFNSIDNIVNLKKKIKIIINDKNGLDLSLKPYSGFKIKNNKNNQTVINFVINIYDEQTHTVSNIRQIFSNEFEYNDNKYLVDELCVTNAYID